MSMITETMALAPEVSLNSRKWLKMSDSPALSAGKYFKTVLPKFVTEHIFMYSYDVCLQIGRYSIRTLD